MALRPICTIAGISVLALVLSAVPAATASPASTLIPADDFEFVATGSLTERRIGAAAALLDDGRVIVIGGYEVSSAEIWDPASGQWTTSGSMAAPREEATATLLAGGRVLVVGGHDGGGEDPAAEIWDPASGTFSVAPDLPGDLPTAAAPVTADGESHTLLRDGRVLVAGGLVRGPNCAGLCSVELSDSAFIRDAIAGADTPTAPMTQPRANHVAVLLRDGRVLLVGSHTHSGLDATAEIFQPRAASPR